MQYIQQRDKTPDGSDAAWREQQEAALTHICDQVASEVGQQILQGPVVMSGELILVTLLLGVR